MPRFKRHRRINPHLAERLFGVRTRSSTAGSRRPAEQMVGRWALLQGHCQDHGSRSRLDRLIARLESRDRGVQESAIAELELATLLLRAGAQVEFLSESQARTADLECQIAGERCFVEVTAMVGTADRALRLGEAILAEDLDAEEGPASPEAIFRDAILARIRQKAKQLADYCAPVVLAISVPRVDDERSRSPWSTKIELDVRHLAGSISMLLPHARHLSGVVLALWDVEPLPATSAVRLTNVSIVERSRQQLAYPRLRMLVRNPSARSPLSGAQTDIFRGLL